MNYDFDGCNVSSSVHKSKVIFNVHGGRVNIVANIIICRNCIGFVFRFSDRYVDSSKPSHH